MTSWRSPLPAPWLRSGRAFGVLAAAVVVLGFGVAPAAGRAAPPPATWFEQPTATNPPGLAYSAMAYDAASEEVVDFGGSSGVQALGDTWTWDGDEWHERSPGTRPPARETASMAYDAKPKKSFSSAA
jgi:hypothetical protein